MKRRIFTLFLAIILLSMSTFSSSFAEERIDGDTAKVLVRNAWSVVKSLHAQFQWFEDGAPVNQRALAGDISVENYAGWNFTSYFRRVKDGFGPDELPRFMGETFTKEVAEYYAPSLWPHYLTVEDTLYYLIQYGAQLGSYVSIQLTDEEIDGLTINEAGQAVIETSYADPWNGDLNHEATLYFSFAKEDGAWKICGMDSLECMFPLFYEEVNQTVFSEELAKTEILAMIGDVYYLTHGDGDALIYYTSLSEARNDGQKALNRWGTTFYSLRGDEGSADKWLEYCTRFAAEPIARKLAFGGSFVVEDNGRMYRGSRSSLMQDNVPEGMAFLSRNALEKATFRVVSQTEQDAVVEAQVVCKTAQPGGTVKSETTELLFAFSAIDGQWKISGGDFLEKLDALYAPDRTVLEEGNNLPEEQPDTGDNFLLPGLAAAALLALPLVRRKRKIAG